MHFSLAITALFMGLVGGPHCVAMCGAACAGMARSAAPGRAPHTLLLFQAGRVLGYSALGALAAASLQGLGWLSVRSSALRPVWTLFHLAALVVGLLLLARAQQPVWLEQAGRFVWARARRLAPGHASATLLLGALWALLPCGLLYSALLLATLAGSAWQGGVLMALFAAGSGVSMLLGPWLWLRLLAARGTAAVQAPRKTDWAALGVRLSGLALAASAAWALWMALAENTAPWCTVG